MRKQTARNRPKPQHKRGAAEMTQIVEGEEINGRVALFGELSDEARLRNPGARKAVVVVMDDELALWDTLASFLPCAVRILDIFYVMERLWFAAFVFHAEGSNAAQNFVTVGLRMLLGPLPVGGVDRGIDRHGEGDARIR